jgi:hypothetical protein
MPGLISADPPTVGGLTFAAPGGSGTVPVGGCVILDDTQSTVALRNSVVTRPTRSNIHRRAFAVTGSSAVSHGGSLQAIPLQDLAYSGVSVLTDANVTAGDILGPQPQTYYFRRGCLYNEYALVALESVNGSSTPALVQCEIVPKMPHWLKVNHQFTVMDDAELPITTDYSTSVEGVPGWPHASADATGTGALASITSGGAYTASPSGTRMKILGSYAVTAGNVDNSRNRLWHHDRSTAFLANYPALIRFRWSIASTSSIAVFVGVSDSEDISITGANGPTQSFNTTYCGLGFDTDQSATAVNIYSRRLAGAPSVTAATGLSVGTTLTNEGVYDTEFLWDGVGSILVFVNNVLVGTVAFAPVTYTGSNDILRRTCEVRYRAAGKTDALFLDFLGKVVVK